ncbi:hypothetical protein ACPTHZ_14275, partial [Enterococcus faecium]|uniref:hypothetical protein n=1 Tax=Enterococcus faecium TaxID=1352 RepID=UPI003CC69095
FNFMREPVYLKNWVIFWREILLARARLFYLFFKEFLEPCYGGSRALLSQRIEKGTNNFLSEY